MGVKGTRKVSEISLNYGIFSFVNYGILCSFSEPHVYVKVEVTPTLNGGSED